MRLAVNVAKLSQHCPVCEDRLSNRRRAIATMNVAKDVQTRLELGHDVQQDWTALMLSTEALAIENSVRWSVDDQNVCFWRNLCVNAAPVLRIAASECPAVETRKWRPPDSQSVTFHSAVYQEGCIRQGRRSGRLNEILMIPRYNDFGRMGKFTQPLIEIRYHRRTFAEECEVTGVDQYVAGRNVEFVMQLVRVGNANDSYDLARLLQINLQAIAPPRRG